MIICEITVLLLVKVRNNEITFFFKSCRLFSVLKYKLGEKNTAGRQHRRWGGHAAADQVPVCWGLDFN